MPKIKISAVVNTRNEEKNLEDCLKTLNFCHEIVICDMESEDRTVEIAKQFTDKVFTYKNVGYVEPARNFAISKAIGDWVLVVDADERIPKSLAQKLKDISESDTADYCLIPRQNLIFGKWIKHSLWWPDHLIRFFKKGSVTWKDDIHSVPAVSGRPLTLLDEKDNAIVHFHYQSLDEYLTRMLRYTREQSKELIASGYKFEPTDIVKKPISEFISRFFAGEGFRDGIHGFVLALLQSFSMLIVYLRVWETEGHHEYDEKDLMRDWKTALSEKAGEFQYWLLTHSIGNTNSKTRKFFLRLKRKFLR